MPSYEMILHNEEIQKANHQICLKIYSNDTSKISQGLHSCNANGLHLFTNESGSRINDNVSELHGEQMFAYFYLYSFLIQRLRKLTKLYRDFIFHFHMKAAAQIILQSAKSFLYSSRSFGISTICNWKWTVQL